MYKHKKSKSIEINVKKMSFFFFLQWRRSLTNKTDDLKSIKNIMDKNCRKVNTQFDISEAEKQKLFFFDKRRQRNHKSCSENFSMMDSMNEMENSKGFTFHILHSD